ncbi:MAG: PqiC family protein [Rhodoferax sp.]|nr:PqiC family protein [Rhodoferax sp.]
MTAGAAKPRGPLAPPDCQPASGGFAEAPRRWSNGAWACLVLPAILALGGCAAFEKPIRPTVYDFGPGVQAAPIPATAQLPPLTLGEVEASGALDNTAVLYRLVYANAQQLLPYAQARWSMPPAQLLRQRLRESLAQQRSVLNPGDGNLASAGMALRVELEEFSQLFDAADRSVGLLRLRVTLVQNGVGGERLLGQRLVVVRRVAPTADAAGGVRALTDAAAAAAEEVESWLMQFR